jgi:hypothetical protein
MGMIAALEHAIKVQSFPGMPRGGDIGLLVPSEEGGLAALIDASGHGLVAYGVAVEARRVIAANAEKSLADLFNLLDRVLQGSVGAAISIARITGENLEFGGVGNVAAYVDLKPLHVQVGIVGEKRPRPLSLSRSHLPAGAWLLMHTDGVRRPDAVPAGSAETAASALVRSHGRTTDDAAVLLLRRREGVA